MLGEFLLDLMAELWLNCHLHPFHGYKDCPIETWLEKTILIALSFSFISCKLQFLNSFIFLP